MFTAFEHGCYRRLIHLHILPVKYIHVCQSIYARSPYMRVQKPLTNVTYDPDNFTVLVGRNCSFGQCHNLFGVIISSELQEKMKILYHMIRGTNISKSKAVVVGCIKTKMYFGTQNCTFCDGKLYFHFAFKKCKTTV